MHLNEGCCPERCPQWGIETSYCGKSLEPLTPHPPTAMVEDLIIGILHIRKCIFCLGKCLDKMPCVDRQLALCGPWQYNYILTYNH